ncbi:hypothetical protein PG997_014705 [Apiospora hydei]|uniref:Uncharacterized protein n=1 Tax=Apiospora hydei TaxID=1337664 RepID=A0ABR1UUL7_9PEZI
MFQIVSKPRTPRPSSQVRPLRPSLATVLDSKLAKNRHHALLTSNTNLISESRPILFLTSSIESSLKYREALPYGVVDTRVNKRLKALPRHAHVIFKDVLDQLLG